MVKIGIFKINSPVKELTNEMVWNFFPRFSLEIIILAHFKAEYV